MIGKVFAGAVLGLSLLGACASEVPPTGSRPGFVAPSPAGGAAGRTATSTPTAPTGTTTSPPLSGGGPAWGGGNQPGVAQVMGMPVGGSGSMMAEDCGSGDFSNPRVQPVVWLVIDGSASMAEPLVPVANADPTLPPTGTSRWDTLRPALMDPTAGVVKILEPLVKFGMVMYDGALPGGVPATTSPTLPDGGPSTGMAPTTECPRLAVVEPALNNFNALNMAIPPVPPGGSTPTHKAMEQVLSHLPMQVAGPDMPVDPVYVVLATDGAPNDYCADPTGGGLGGLFGPPGGGSAQYQQMVVSLTQQMAMRGVPVYVVSLAANDAALSSHLAQVAQAGGTMKPPFTPQNKDQLLATFQEIIGPEALCTVKLMKGFGVMPSAACMGTVSLNGQKLECDSDNGWKLRDPKTIEVTGTACEMYKKLTNARLTANFPCEVQIAG